MFKAYDSIDRETINTLKEFGADDKTIVITNQTITNTKSNIQFLVEILKSIEFKARIKLGDGLSKLIFSSALEKSIRGRRKKTEAEQLQKIKFW